MQVKFDLKLGQTIYTLLVEATTPTEFFKKLHFYQSLPTVGPNGETDLVLSYRVAQKQYEYYSIVSQSAGMEYKFGQYKDRPGELFGKGWEPLFQAQETDESQPQTEYNAAPAPTPAPTAARPAQTRPMTAARPAAAPAAAPATTTPPVAQNVSNVLSKFGIGA